MSEFDTISKSAVPLTIESLIAGLTTLGMRSGETVLVHTSLSSLGWVCGGPVAIIEALLTVLGLDGTLVMPTQSCGLSEPSNWAHPAVPEQWWPTIRSTMPAFDVRKTPTQHMGAVAELFRTWPGVLRSNHPTCSMAAFGPLAAELLLQHPLEDPLGELSPLGRLYEQNSRVLLLGVGHDSNTSLHLAERKAFRDRQARTDNGSPIVREGSRHWVEYAEPTIDSGDFNLLGAEFEAATRSAMRSRIGAGEACLMRQRELIDFAVPWLRRHRDPEGRPTQR